MKKFISLMILSLSSFAFHVDGYVNFGAFINCEIYNEFRTPIVVRDYSYSIVLRNGAIQNVFYTCGYNCEIMPNSYSNFSGPRNAGFVYDAYCSANAIRVRR